MQTNFADIIINIAVTGPLVRIELGTLNPVQSKDGKLEHQPVVNQQLVMPIEGFARSLAMQEQVVKKLVEDGVLKPAQNQGPMT